MKRRNHVDQPKLGISFDNIIYTIHIKVSALLGSKYFNLSTQKLMYQNSTRAEVLVLVGESNKEGVRGLGACMWSCQ